MKAVGVAAGDDGIDDGDEQPGTLWQLLRCAQRTSGCTTKTLAAIEATLRPLIMQRFGGASGQTANDKELLEKANAVLLQLHGCVGCHDFVFLPSDVRTRCPRCRHPRFNNEKKPNEVYYDVCDLHDGSTCGCLLSHATTEKNLVMINNKLLCKCRYAGTFQ